METSQVGPTLLVTLRAHLHKKMKKGRAYYYIRESKRMNGKPTIVNQVYLGSADKLLATLLARDQALPTRLASKEFGSLFMLNEIDRALDLAALVEQVSPRKRQTPGPSGGELIYFAAVNRAIAPPKQTPTGRVVRRHRQPPYPPSTA
jgi:hypothetical protein